MKVDDLVLGKIFDVNLWPRGNSDGMKIYFATFLW